MITPVEKLTGIIMSFHERDKYKPYPTKNPRRESGYAQKIKDRNDSPIYNENRRSINQPPPPPPILKSETHRVAFLLEDFYEKVALVGEGTYGKVYKGREKSSNKIVAIKQLRRENEKEGIAITTVREIKYLQVVDHPNIIQLYNIHQDDEGLYLIFEYMDYDLTGLVLHPNVKLAPANIKHFAKQLFESLEALHKQDILHRDIKGSNFLVDKKGIMKLADFGLARALSPFNRGELTNRVITLWYRPLELLLGSTDYGPEIDIWSAGCIILEMILGRPLFDGTDEVSQIESIYDLMGTISLDEWPEAQNMPWFKLVNPSQSKESRFDRLIMDQNLSPSAFDLLKRALSINPKNRITAEEALNHDYFKEEPLPLAPDLSSLGDIDYHEYDAKLNRKEKL